MWCLTELVLIAVFSTRLPSVVQGIRSAQPLAESLILNDTLQPTSTAWDLCAPWEEILTYEKELGKGSQGSVVLAHFDGACLQDAVKVAVKHMQVKEHRAEMFARNEVAVLKLMNSNPFTVSIWDANYDTDESGNGRLAILMEGLTGGDLKDVVSSDKDELYRAHVFIDTIMGVLSMHARQLVHRDIKPANVFVTQQGRAKLGDLAMACHVPATQEHVMACGDGAEGSPLFIAPEAYDGGQSYSSDVWALGIMLYQLVSRSNDAPTHILFDQDLKPRVNGIQVMKALATFDIEKDLEKAPMSEILQKMQPHVKNLLLGMLQQDQDKRIDLNSALERAFEWADALHSSEIGKKGVWRWDAPLSGKAPECFQPVGNL